MNFGQLLRGKYVIETMEVNDLVLGTRRTTDGSLPESRKPAPPDEGESTFSTLGRQAFERTVERTPLFDLAAIRKGMNIDSLLRSQNLQTLVFIDSLKQQTASAARQWQSTLNDVERSTQRLKEIESSATSINPSELKTPDRILAAINTVDGAYKGVQEVTQTATDRGTSVTADIKRLSTSAGMIDDVASHDFQRLLSLARLPNLSTSGIAEILLGPQLKKDAEKILYWIDFARKHVPQSSSKPEMESPPRLRGQNILFPVTRGYPKLWIRKLIVSGGTDRTQNPDYIYAKGEIRDISTDQKIAGAPLTVSLDGTKGGTLAFGLSGLFDRMQDVPLDEYKVHASGIKLSAFELGKSDFLPGQITNAGLNTSLTISIPGKRFDSNVKMEFRNLSLQFNAVPKNDVERLTRQVLEGVNGFNLSLRLWNTGDAFDVALATDLDDQFARRLKDILGAEVDRLENELRAKVNQKIAAKREEFETAYNSAKAQAEQKLGEYKSAVDGVTSLLDGKKKQLADQLEKQKAGKLNDALKGLLKK
jgi:uncharacterized protein (TIGR03545 family)